MNALEDITAANRASWNSIHPARPGHPPAFLAAGGTALQPEELAAAGDVTNRRLLHVACSCGDEALSWAAQGATVTGIDISEVAIAQARAKSEATGIHVDFHRADLFDLPPELVDFDLIYLSWGAICWVPDLTRWAAVIADRLAPGGAVLLAEHHPVWEVLTAKDPSTLELTADYFGRTTPRAVIENSKLPTGARDTPEPPPFSAYIWPAADVITALLAAGLCLTHFSESPASHSYPALGDRAEWLPATYLVRAERDVSRGTSPRVPK
ncbi:methyltransferase domain-containing protein [Kribbella sandramycini]|uniref:2-polyprenyl-3-methyl-5-hydroxy-6-metoxy-1, 4-benzoquinol methylase n=1 Tax=Kribbella sandramycini TaxID=60450 RepID=A0A7Y4L022_9ACTN|nr:2-polyprenyl-3-methyl-5-hydroxy-6-metoxy-1,4-benzoquinol methylase [Kribbella sandramycini]NOL41813.1 methyltransferase domain-containing protein [Kribbella sandramycini]